MKTMKTIAIFLTSTFLFASCSIFKTIKLIKQGEIEQKQFKVQIPFENRAGLIVLKVKINEIEHDFLFDTGAPTVLSENLFKKLNLKVKSDQKTTDSQGNTSQLGFVEVDKISIGKINFLNIGAAVTDLNQTPEMSCMKIDGILGANLMRKGIWQIDYDKQIITITNSKDSLLIPENANIIKFSPDLAGIPLTEVNYNGTIDKNVTIDLGSNGDFSSSIKVFNKFNNKYVPIYRFGAKASGAFGSSSAIDTTIYAIIPEIKLGDIALSNQIVEFQKNAKTIGTEFFKNYRVIINWFDNELIMVKNKDYNYSTLKSYGISPIFKENKIFVGSIYMNSSASDQGIKLGDQILEMDGKNFRNCNNDCWCDEIIEGYNVKESQPMSVIILRDNQELKFQLKFNKLL
jgi:hypothetical protein